VLRIGGPAKTSLVPVSTTLAPAAGPAQPGGRKRRSRKVTALVVAVVLIVVLAAGGGSYLLLRTKGSPQQTASAYLTAWQQGKFATMSHVSVGVPQGGLAGPLNAVSTQLGVRSMQLKLGAVTSSGGTAQAHFTVTDHLASSQAWTYQGVLDLVNRNRLWWVNWSPAAIYPGLKAGERFVLTSTWPTRAPILDANGNVLSSPAVIAQSGSIGLLTGIVAPATKGEAKKLGAPYKAGDPVGLGGIEGAYQTRLAGQPALTVRLVGPGKQVDKTAARFKAVPGLPVKTSIELPVQLAAGQAVLDAKTKLPVDMVVVQPSTGKILAVVEKPGGEDRALLGIFPPGSTFKVVTASALAQTGYTPQTQVQCPSKVDIGGLVIHNNQNEHYGTTTFLNAFAVSCNTTFADLGATKLSAQQLSSMARTFGFNTKPALGIPAIMGSFIRPKSTVDQAADAFGQGKDLVNPLSQATMAAAIEDGTWRPPLLVTSPAPRQTAHPHVLSPTILTALRPMMRAVVTNGTAASVPFPPGVYGKTGTAQYAVGSKLKSHGWFIGYDGDLAFAVLVEGGGYGASSAAPIANSFLHKY
jgi:Penicillin binding protein transpeptidase domain/NTF2-like N-terminal transpeptidase domain